MEEMKHLDGFAPSAEDTAKLNEFVTWLVEHGFQGIVMIHKGDIGVSRWATSMMLTRRPELTLRKASFWRQIKFRRSHDFHEH